MKNSLNRRPIVWVACLLVWSSLLNAGIPDERPNVVIIYTDDVGYGDIGAYGAELVPTPNIDQLADEGIRFTDGHAGASTCSPSRYALLTGKMGFRGGVHIQPVNAKLTISPDEFTLADLFKQAGYQTAIVGKWHLGLGDGDVDWNGIIEPGPNELGFDYSFIIPSSNDRAPFVYVENKRVYNFDPDDPITVSYRPIPDSVPGTKYPSGRENPEAELIYTANKGHQGTIINGLSRIGFMKGGKKAIWNDHDIANDLTGKAIQFMDTSKAHPFFLLLSTNDIHAPRLPHPRFKGSTTLGYRGDNLVQLDWCVGQITQYLRENGLVENTILIFSSDNGPVYVDGGYQDGSGRGGHDANGIYRGGKYQIYEAGTRVPFIIKWPPVIEPQVSDALVSQVDLLASFAAYLDIEIPEVEKLDSRAYWDTFTGKSEKGADLILQQTNRKRPLALRKGPMKFIAHDLENEKEALYDLATDPSETTNIIEQNPELAEQMRNELNQLSREPINSVY